MTQRNENMDAIVKQLAEKYGGMSLQKEDAQPNPPATAQRQRPSSTTSSVPRRLPQRAASLGDKPLGLIEASKMGMNTKATGKPARKPVALLPCDWEALETMLLKKSMTF